MLETKAGKRHQVSLSFVAALTAVFLVAAPALLFGYNMVLEKQIQASESLLIAPESIETVSRIETKGIQLEAANKAAGELAVKDSLLTASEVISEKSLQVVVDTLPKQVRLDSLMIMGSDIGMQGTAVDRPAIAELAYNIRQSGLSEGIVLPTITQNVAGGFDFSLNFKLKAVSAQ